MEFISAVIYYFLAYFLNFNILKNISFVFKIFAELFIMSKQISEIRHITQFQLPGWKGLGSTRF